MLVGDDDTHGYHFMIDNEMIVNLQLEVLPSLCRWVVEPMEGD